MNEIISLKNISAYRGDTLALENITLTLKLGEHVAILGPNGSGKSTLIKLITREVYPVHKQESSIRIFGKEHVDIWELRKKIGMVSADYQNDYKSLATGLDVVVSGFFGSVGIHGHQTVTSDHLDRAKEVMADLEISYLEDAQYLKLSTGQQRRLLLARALVRNPKILLLDEPSNGLDIQARFWLLRTLRKLAQTGTTIVCVTHELHELIPEIDRVVLLKQGQVIADGPKLIHLNSANLCELFETNLKLIYEEGHIQAFPT